MDEEKIAGLMRDAAELFQEMADIVGTTPEYTAHVEEFQKRVREAFPAKET